MILRIWETYRLTYKFNYNCRSRLSKTHEPSGSQIATYQQFFRFIIGDNKDVQLEGFAGQLALQEKKDWIYYTVKPTDGEIQILSTSTARV